MIADQAFSDLNVETITVDDDTFDALLAMLDRPAHPSPRLAELLSRPSRITHTNTEEDSP